MYIHDYTHTYTHTYMRIYYTYVSILHYSLLEWSSLRIPAYRRAPGPRAVSSMYIYIYIYVCIIISISIRINISISISISISMMFPIRRIHQPGF